MLKIGVRGCRETVVTEAMTAKAMGSGELPVCATPALVALAEETAWKSVAELLEPGQSTVGTKLDFAHIAATPVGRRVRCETELTELDRRRMVFSVVVYDEAGKIAEGVHERFAVDAERFLRKANDR
ncbi:MAG: thioesterase [Oscillospiraceae bacterium]|nr:thioesterase [Oscillospiraceae bacterium]